MNSLEFIEQQISSTEIDIWYSNSLLKETPQNEELKREVLEIKLRVLERQMNMLQQIKTELEAWYETKKYLVLNDKTLAFYDSTFEYITLKNDCIDESNSEEEGISIMSIKKALEVKE